MIQKKIPSKKPAPQSSSSPYSHKFCNPIVLSVVSFCVWFIWHSLSPTLPAQDTPPILYSNQCNQDLTLTFLEAIKHTKQSIHLVMFGLSDPAILKALNKQIKKEIPTTIYYDWNHSPNLRQLLAGGEIHPVLLAGLMHQKILIIDEEISFLGSANMTTASLRMHDNLVVGLNSKQVAQFLKEKTPHHPGYLHTIVGGQAIDLWLLPDLKGHALNALRKQIRLAHRSIEMALFTFTHAPLIDELLYAKKRGVEITVAIDMHSGVGASAKTVEKLEEAGINVLLSQGTQLLHHKFIYIDEHTLITGSANWTKSAFTKNSDSLLILHDLSDEQKKFMNRLWHKIQSGARKQRSA